MNYQEEIIFIENLSKKHKYKKLNPKLSKEVRERYTLNIFEELNINGDEEFEIMSKYGRLISKGYKRIVVGDYGAFIEITPETIVEENLRCEYGQEFRKEKNHSSKYIWLTTKDRSTCKIYLQKGEVSYADYKVGMYYISPYDILIRKRRK